MLAVAYIYLQLLTSDVEPIGIVSDTMVQKVGEPASEWNRQIVKHPTMGV